MSSSKKRKMVALKVLETSGVDHPAHLEEGWIVMKSATKEANVSEEVLMDPSLEEAYIERVVELEKALEASAAQVEKLQKENSQIKAKLASLSDESEKLGGLKVMYNAVPNLFTSPTLIED